MGLQRYPSEQQAAARAASLAATLELMEATLERLSVSGGWPRRRIHLLGFSQGGTVALHLAANSWWVVQVIEGYNMECLDNDVAKLYVRFSRGITRCFAVPLHAEHLAAKQCAQRSLQTVGNCAHFGACISLHLSFRQRNANCPVVFRTRRQSHQCRIAVQGWPGPGHPCRRHSAHSARLHGSGPDFSATERTSEISCCHAGVARPLVAASRLRRPCCQGRKALLTFRRFRYSFLMPARQQVGSHGVRRLSLT